jgi:hypothetical protein
MHPEAGFGLEHLEHADVPNRITAETALSLDCTMVLVD